MTVRAKFRLTSYETTIHNRPQRGDDGEYLREDPDNPRSGYVYKDEEMRTLHLMAVGDSGPENRQFWDATPEGQIKLSTVNPEAWSHFELNQEYYVDFTPAPNTDAPAFD